MDIILIILTLSLDEEISNASPYLRYVNGVFVGVYTSEAIMKVIFFLKCVCTVNLRRCSSAARFL